MVRLKTWEMTPSHGMSLEAFLDLVYRSSFWLAAAILTAILAYTVYASLRRR